MTATDTATARLQSRRRRATRSFELSSFPSPRPPAPFWTGRWLQIIYVIIDVVFVAVNCTMAVFLRSGYWPRFDTLTQVISRVGWEGVDQSANFYLASLVLYGALVVVCCQNQRLYRTARNSTSFDETLSVLKAVGVATLLLGAFIFLSGVKTVPRSVVACSALLNIVTLSGWRVLRRGLVRRRVLRGIGSRNVLIVGTGSVGKALAAFFQDNPHLGYVVKGFLDERVDGDSAMLGALEDLPRVAQAHFVDEIFVTIPERRALVKQLVLDAEKQRVCVNVIPELFDGLGKRAPIRYVGDFPVMELHREPIPEFGLFVKRLLDVIFAGFGLVLTAPFLMALALAIKVDSEGPVFYCAPRVGKRGRIFTCFKLRTMSTDADMRKEQLRHLNERSGPFFKIADDPRITRVGRWLRKYSLDELPQLWNVLRGEMSLVGPRPHPTDDFRNYDISHLRRLDVWPGLTGLWQVTARRDPSFEKSLALDLEYIETWSFWLDVRILLKTVPEVIRASGV